MILCQDQNQHYVRILSLMSYLFRKCKGGELQTVTARHLALCTNLKKGRINWRGSKLIVTLTFYVGLTNFTQKIHRQSHLLTSKQNTKIIKGIRRGLSPRFKFGLNPSLIDGILNVLPYELVSWKDYEKTKKWSK